MQIKCYRYWPSTEEETKNFGGFKITLDSVDVFAEYAIKSITICLVRLLVLMQLD